MKIPPNVHVVRLTGLGLAMPPRGFDRAELRGDPRYYAVRKGYRLERCPREKPHREILDCSTCGPMWGVIAVKIPEDGAVLPEYRAKSSGRLATDFERMHRDRVLADAAETMEEALPGFNKAWRRATPRDDRSIRTRLTSARDAGLIGRKS